MAKRAQDAPQASPFDGEGLAVSPTFRPRWSDTGWILRYAIAGCWQLVVARMEFMRFDVRSVPTRNAALNCGKPVTDEPTRRHIQRIGYVLPRISRRLPWRSDCLIQAIAGQNWLKRNSIASAIEIGVELPDQGRFAAHAWLKCGDIIVTGGAIDRYEMLIGDETQPQ